MKVYLTYGGFLVIFISMVSLLFMFQSMASFGASCSAANCDQAGFMTITAFGFLVAGAFILFASMSLYIITREATGPSGRNVADESPEKLDSELAQLKLSKKEAEKQYYKGKIGSKSFQEMMKDYDKKIIDSKSKIKMMRKAAK
jgi:hypothetical protein